MDEREIRELFSGDALDAFWIFVLHWLHIDVPFRRFPLEARARRNSEVQVLANLLCSAWNLVSLLDHDHHRRNGQSLLSRRLRGVLCRY